jgi:hypothetical protein
VRTAAIVGWSGYGEFGELMASASSKLAMGEGRLTTGSRTLTVNGADPVAVARRLAFLPGVSWIAAGYQFDDEAACTARLKLLAVRYLRRGSSFRLTAEVESSGREEGDILLDGNGSILKAVAGTRVDEKAPDVTFRVVMVKDRGAVGVQLRAGPGGVPTSKAAKASCLVSGGYHSAVVAWMAALSGFSLTLVHARTDDESLRQVARLYAELSRRMDTRYLKLEVLDGVGSPGERLANWLDGAKGDIMAGVHPQCRGRKARSTLRSYPQILVPLLLVQEEGVRAGLDSLGIKVKAQDAAAALLVTGRKSPYIVRRVGGIETDISGVLDGLLG